MNLRIKPSSKHSPNFYSCRHLCGYTDYKHINLGALQRGMNSPLGPAQRLWWGGKKSLVVILSNKNLFFRSILVLLYYLNALLKIWRNSLFYLKQQIFLNCWHNAVISFPMSQQLQCQYIKEHFADEKRQNNNSVEYNQVSYIILGNRSFLLELGVINL